MVRVTVTEPADSAARAIEEGRVVAPGPAEDAVGMSDETYVIVGASLAGAKAAETLREEGFTGRVVLIGEETEPPYERPPLSKGYLLGAEPAGEGLRRTNRSGTPSNGIEWRAGTARGRSWISQPARSHRTPTDTVALRQAAAGHRSRVRTLTAPGSDLQGVRYLRTLDQSDALLEGFREGAHVVVIGAGWIGLETAAAARQHGCAVTVVEMDSLPLRRVLGDEVATVYRDLHAAHGSTSGSAPACRRSSAPTAR